MMAELSPIIANQLALKLMSVEATVELLQSGATIPFIARYRKERTGGLDEVQIAAIKDELDRLSVLQERKETILKTIEGQGKLTQELKSRFENCWLSSELEDLYLPYKPHRKTRADIAIERGLEPLANILQKQQRIHVRETASQFLNKDVPSIEDALQGARDIIAERMSQNEMARNAVRREFNYSAIISSKVVKGKEDNDEAQNYKDYFAREERLNRIASNRLLAMRRGEKEGFLKVDISPDSEKCLDKLARIFLLADNDASYQVELAMEDSYKRLLKPSIETEYAQASKQAADMEAIRIFAENLKQLLFSAPLGQKRVLALDPGFRTGCKMVCLSAQGALLAHDVIYPHPPVSKVAESTEKLHKAILDYQIEAISIGNGTASRETEQFVRDALRYGHFDKEPEVYVVSENGASVYSASKIAREEFPKEDVTVRGAVSIGRRLMDPLAELVKIDPKSIGVGQYQYDVDQVRLRDSLTQTVESVVNRVGVDVNTASQHLLTYISGLGPSIAQNIVDYRTTNGPFPNRQALKNVPKMGAKTFEQAAGFLRVTGSDNPLDNSAVHPESYPIVNKMAKDLGCTIHELMSNEALRKQIDITQYITEKTGLPTLTDIMHELEKPSRDPRAQIEVFRFDDNVHDLNDLKIGMELPGIVTNIAAFGAFVDIGVHKDGLIHISQMGRKNLRQPQEVVSLHQHIKVEVIDIDQTRSRIQLRLVKN